MVFPVGGKSTFFRFIELEREGGREGGRVITFKAPFLSWRFDCVWVWVCGWVGVWPEYAAYFCSIFEEDDRFASQKIFEKPFFKKIDLS